MLYVREAHAPGEPNDRNEISYETKCAELEITGAHESPALGV